MTYYSGGVVAGVESLMSIIKGIVVNHGWTVVTNNGTAIHYRLPTGHYLTMNCVTSESSWNTQYPDPSMYLRLSPSATIYADSDSTKSRTTGLWGPFTAYHIFCDTDYLQVVVEVSPLVYAHFGYIMHQDKWNYGGGECIYGTCWNYNYNANQYYNYRTKATDAQHSRPFDQNGHYGTLSTIVRCDLEGVSPRYFRHYYGITNNFMLGGYPVGDKAMLNNGVNITYSPNNMNGIEVLMPIINGVRLSDKTRIIGRVPNMRSVNITNRAPGEVINYGSDEWMVFPIKKKQLTTPELEDLSSGIYGLAYKK